MAEHLERELGPVCNYPTCDSPASCPGGHCEQHDRPHGPELEDIADDDGHIVGDWGRI